MLDISGAFNYEKSRLFAEKLDTGYPFLTCLAIGRTYLGRAIFSFSLGNVNNSVIITGGTGGKSAQTSLVLYKFTESICESVFCGKEVSGVDFSVLVRKFGITVIPCLNPDSCEIAFEGYNALKNECISKECFEKEKWNANSAGVDIDLNFDSDWRKEKMLSLEKNILFACGEGFPGNSKESEPEIRAFTSLCRRHNFRSCLTLRTGKNGIYYRRKGNSPASSAMMAKILASSGFSGVSEKEIPPCPSRWFSDKFSKPSFLIETEKEDALSLYNKLEEALVLMSVM